MREKPWFAVLYMFVVTAFFSFLLIGFAKITHARVVANKQIAFETAVLRVFALDKQKIHETFIDSIKPPTKDSNNAYLLIQNNITAGYALPFEGKGFWAQIKGVIGFAPDKKTITGIAFYEQNETPGLGAKITNPEFRNQFKDKMLSSSEKPLEILPFGSTLTENQVHAISGATQTCTRLENFLNETLLEWIAAAKTEGEK